MGEGRKEMNGKMRLGMVAQAGPLSTQKADTGGLGLHDHLGYVMNLRLDWSTWDSPLNPNQPEQNKKENMKSILEDFR